MLRKVITIMFSFSLLSLSSLALSHGKTPQSESPANAKAYIIEPADGAEVSETFTVRFGLKGMGVAPAGTNRKNTGHHHLLIDSDTLPKSEEPMGSNVKHFGGGQTETEITLTKGKHTLQLVLGDHFHIPHEPMVASKKITVIVK